MSKLAFWTFIIAMMSVNTSYPQGSALRFDGTNDYVTFGPAPALGAARFTIETWFILQTNGTADSTGTGGIPDAIPLLTKGTAENEIGFTNANYFLGIDQSSLRLVADFEEGDAGASPGLNHPVTGATVIVSNVWNHAAATYDGTSWNIYLNGILDATVSVGQPPQSNSIQHAGLGTGLTTAGAPHGFWGGTLDEPRVWNYARSVSEIRAGMITEIASASGLLGRWGLNEGLGLSAANSAGGYANGSLSNGPAWVHGFPFSQLGAGGLYFDGEDDRVSFGPTSALGLATFTLETWFKWLGPGQTVTTGSGGVTNAFPLITKGRGGVGSGTNDVNYFLGIRASDGVLVADFEEGATGTSPGQNHPVIGITPLVSNQWHHAAATYDGTNWSLYLNGVLETTDSVGEPPRSDSALHAGLATTYDAGGVPAGYFYGVLDEARIWNYARNAGEVFSNKNLSILSAAGLVGRWGLNETNGLTAANTANAGLPGTLASGPVWVNGSAFADPGYGGLFFDGANDQVTFGPAPTLGATNFTIETWFKRLGVGQITTTGSGGITNVIPLVTKGRGEVDQTNSLDMNYFLGIRASDNVLVADFEEGSNGASPSLNHPVFGTTAITNDIWYHAAATYNGTSWNLYLNGALQTSSNIGQPPRGDSIQHAGLGTAYTSSGAPQGFFNGVLDEVRIWNYARTGTEITNNLGFELSAASGLLGRWSLNETSGVVAANSANPAVPGALSNGPIWTAGAPLLVNDPPNAPILTAPANNATNVSTNATLTATVTDPEGTNMTVTFYGRPLQSAGPDFTVIALPDTQYYSSGLNGGNVTHFIAQTEWIISNRVSRNIKFMTQLGDCVENGDSFLAEWLNATNALYRLEDPIKTALAEGLPYGVAVGNHDQSPIGDPEGTTIYYNQFFGTNHFGGRAYYGGNYSTNNDNHFELFSASGLDFVVVHGEWDPTPDAAVINWANGIFQAYSNRLGIFVTHTLINTGDAATFNSQGQAWFDGLKTNANLSLMFCGHVPGEGRRQEVFGGRTIHIVMSDYQGRSNGGDGWLRINEFSPSNNVIRVKTFSPTLNQFEVDSSSDFTLSYAMSSGSAYTVIAVVSNVPSGSSPSVVWSNLQPNTTYEWYAMATDSAGSTASTAFRFTTGSSGCADCDGDGLLDAWELQHFATTTNGAGGDVDGDGQNNLNEFVSGTQPTNNTSLFIIRTLFASTPSQTSRVVRVATEPSKKYAIFFADSNLTNNLTWTSFANTNNGIGTWVETSPVSTNRNFVDDEGPNTTLGPPASLRRTYRVTVENP